MSAVVSVDEIMRMCRRHACKRWCSGGGGIAQGGLRLAGPHECQAACGKLVRQRVRGCAQQQAVVQGGLCAAGERCRVIGTCGTGNRALSAVVQHLANKWLSRAAALHVLACVQFAACDRLLCREVEPPDMADPRAA